MKVLRGRRLGDYNWQKKRGRRARAGLMNFPALPRRAQTRREKRLAAAGGYPCRHDLA